MKMRRASRANATVARRAAQAVLVSTCVSATLLVGSIGAARAVVTTIVTTTVQRRVWTGNTWTCTATEGVVGSGSTAGAPTPLPSVHLTHCVWDPGHWVWKTISSTTRSWTTPCRIIGYVSISPKPNGPIVLHLGDSCTGYGRHPVTKHPGSIVVP